MADGDLKVEPPRSAVTPRILSMEFRLADLKAGQPDPRGRHVEDILWAVNEFKIYRTRVGISPFFADDPELALQQKKTYLGMGAAIADFNHLINTFNEGWQPLMSTRRKAEAPDTGEPEVALARRPAAPGPSKESGRNMGTELYERELARCIAQALLGEPDRALEALKDLRSRLAAQIANRARVVHLGINLVLVSAVLLIALAFAYSGYQTVFAAREISLAMMMGAVGALFSTTVRLQSMAVDPTVTTLMHWVYGAQRVLVGGLGALVIYFGFKSGVVNGLFVPVAGAIETTEPFNPYWLSFVCVLAGFSERLVPNLLDSQAQSAMREKEPALT